MGGTSCSASPVVNASRNSVTRWRCAAAASMRCEPTARATAAEHLEPSCGRRDACRQRWAEMEGIVPDARHLRCHRRHIGDFVKDRPDGAPLAARPPRRADPPAAIRCVHFRRRRGLRLARQRGCRTGRGDRLRGSARAERAVLHAHGTQRIPCGLASAAARQCSSPSSAHDNAPRRGPPAVALGSDGMMARAHKSPRDAAAGGRGHLWSVRLLRGRGRRVPELTTHTPARAGGRRSGFSAIAPPALRPQQCGGGATHGAGLGRDRRLGGRRRRAARQRLQHAVRRCSTLQRGVLCRNTLHCAAARRLVATGRAMVATGQRGSAARSGAERSVHSAVTDVRPIQRTSAVQRRVCRRVGTGAGGWKRVRRQGCRRRQASA